MSAPAAQHRLTYAEYLERERTAEVKAELFDGELWLMSGGTPDHALLTNNLGAVLHAILRGRPCRAYAESLRIYLPDLDEGAYPDLKVICGEVEHHEADDQAAINPLLLCEVLSDRTELYDRGEKFAKYRTLQSLQAYLLVDQHARRLELFERNDDGTWTYSVAGAGESLRLRSLELALPVDEVYEGVEPTPRPRRSER